MGLLTPGYWPDTYWPSAFWVDNYWLEYGTNIPVPKIHPHYWMLIEYREARHDIKFRDKPGRPAFEPVTGPVRFSDKDTKMTTRGR